jgi:hypothetical protein
MPLLGDAKKSQLSPKKSRHGADLGGSRENMGTRKSRSGRTPAGHWEHVMSETSAPARRPGRPKLESAHEAYSFACLNCGFVWEQAYEIEHVVDYNGQMAYRYTANGVPVASPLTHPACPGCGGPHVRIMASGQVAHANAGQFYDPDTREARLLAEHMAESPGGSPRDQAAPRPPAPETARHHWWNRRSH